MLGVSPAGHDRREHAHERQAQLDALASLAEGIERIDERTVTALCKQAGAWPVYKLQSRRAVIADVRVLRRFACSAPLQRATQSFAPAYCCSSSANFSPTLSRHSTWVRLPALAPCSACVSVAVTGALVAEHLLRTRGLVLPEQARCVLYGHEDLPVDSAAVSTFPRACMRRRRASGAGRCKVCRQVRRPGYTRSELLPPL